MLRDHIKNHYNAVASTWRKKAWVDDTNFQGTIRQFANLSGTEQLLDVGVGAGDFSSLFKVHSITGIDISRHHLNECIKIHPKIRLILGDAEHLPFKNDEFDVVCSRNLLQNFEGPFVIIKEMLRTLKPGGKLIVVESAVFEDERVYPTAVCRVVEPLHPLFPSHEFLKSQFTRVGTGYFEQSIVKVHKKWLGRWQESKGATNRQREMIYQICEKYPPWYKKKYNFKFCPNELEVESSMTFSLINFIKTT